MNLDHLLDNPDLNNYKSKKLKKTIQPGNGFDNLDIAPVLRTGINQLHFNSPTPIQTASIPVGIEGRDIIAIARTGSGKTIAFGIPMLQRLSKNKHGTGLVIVPTRELALQVEESLQSLSRLVKIRSTVLIGGASINLQMRELKKNPRVVIATPGRLMDHINRHYIKLDNVSVLILDEADRMLDMGFLPDIKKILTVIPEKRQTMLFSATMPKEIEAMAEDFMDNPEHIEIDRSGTTPIEVSHEMFFIKREDKSRLLAVQLQQCAGPVLVFTRTKRMASRLTKKVKRMGFSAAEIHSDRSQGQRRAALDGFKDGRYQILIATDIAARGIDVTGIELVVNFDMPANSEDYVHRIGRTGRAGKAGHAISFATDDQRGSIRSLERFMKTKLEIAAIPALPSEENLFQQADYYHENSKKTRGPKASARKSPKQKSVDYENWEQSDPKTFGMRLNAARRGRVKAPVYRSPELLAYDSDGDRNFRSKSKKSKTAKRKYTGQNAKRKYRRSGQ